MGVIRSKIWYDLWENKGRTLRVVMIIAIGAFAVGMVFGATDFMLRDVSRTWAASNPATIGLDVDPAVDEDMLNSLENLRGVDTVEGWHVERIQWRRSPQEPWQVGFLAAIDDYEDQDLRRIFLDAGAWPHRKQMGVQRGFQFEPGQQVYLDIKDERHTVELNGVIYNAAQPPPFVAPQPMFYTTQQRFAELTGEANYSRVLATVPDYTPAANEAAANRIQNELEKQDVAVDPAIPKPGGFLTRTSNPERFIAQDTLDGVIFILRVLAVTSLLLGMFLVYNTVNAIISQQIQQIGVMKAIGASFRTILGIYMRLIAVYAGLALVVAVPLGALAAHGLRVGMVEGRFMMEAGPFQLSPVAVTVQIVVAVLAPLLVAIVPIAAGARITVREAISTYGLGGTTGLLDRLVAYFAFIPRLVSLTVGNTFRNIKRVILTQLTLIGAGIIFLMVMHTAATLTNTFSDVLLVMFRSNVMLDLRQPERINEIERLTLAQPGVEAVEVWASSEGTARLRGQPESNDDEAVKLRGLPLPVQTYQPNISAGRWLRPGDEYAIVLNQELAEEIGVGVGDVVTIDIPTEREAAWQVVGLVFEPLEQDAAMVPRETLLYEIRERGQGTEIKVQTTRQSAGAEAAMARRLRQVYEANSYEVRASNTETAHEMINERLTQMSTLLGLLGVMAALIAAVGAVALSGTLAINVLERTREIGVMRAVGASSGAVVFQFIGEGLLLGWLSWLLAIPLSIPVTHLIIQILGGLMNIELVYRFSQGGVLYWFVIISLLAVIASWFPARKAAQTSVRESLAYA